MTRKYYYLVDATDTYAVSSIAKGGSRAFTINHFDKKEFVTPVLLDIEDAEKLLAKETASGNKYWWKDAGKPRYEIEVNWVIKSVEVTF